MASGRSCGGKVCKKKKKTTVVAGHGGNCSIKTYQRQDFKQKPAVNDPLAPKKKILMGASPVSISSASKIVVPNIKPVIACFIIRSTGLHSLTVNPTLRFNSDIYVASREKRAVKTQLFNYDHLAGVRANADSLTCWAPSVVLS